MWFKEFFLIVFCVQSSYGFPTGASTQACTSLTPNHGLNSPQNSPAPVSVTLSTPSVTEGQTLRLTITITQPQRTLRGIIIQARTVGANPVVVGQFFESTELRFLNCVTLPANSVLTHRTSAERSVFVIDWQAPSSFAGLPASIRFQ